jgi:hypothetical protein
MQTKINQVKKHLLKKKSITSWDAIIQYKATRLSAIIFNLRKNGWDIVTNNITSKDKDGNSSTYAKYVLISSPATKS